jgi:DNA-binding CsgD family transcriptional regulator
MRPSLIANLVLVEAGLERRGPIRAEIGVGPRVEHDGPMLAPAEAAGLEAALGEIPSPAFVLWTDGRVALANTPGRAASLRDPETVAARLLASLDGRDDTLRVTPIHSPGVARHYLVVQQPGTLDPGPRVTAATARWGITPRQGEVLALLALGQSNKAIAGALGCAGSTVEIHVTALFAKSGCQSRSELISRFWSEPIAPPGRAAGENAACTDDPGRTHAAPQRRDPMKGARKTTRTPEVHPTAIPKEVDLPVTAVRKPEAASGGLPSIIRSAGKSPPIPPGPSPSPSGTKDAP